MEVNLEDICVLLHPKINHQDFQIIFLTERGVVLNIGRVHHRMSLDMESGYCQILFHHISWPKMALFGMNGDITRNKTPVRAQNATTVFLYMISVIQAEWKEEEYSQYIPDIGSEVIMYYIILFVIILTELLNYIEVLLEILTHYRCDLKLNDNDGRKSNVSVFTKYVVTKLMSSN